MNLLIEKKNISMSKIYYFKLYVMKYLIANYYVFLCCCENFLFFAVISCKRDFYILSHISSSIYLTRDANVTTQYSFKVKKERHTDHLEIS